MAMKMFLLLNGMGVIFLLYVLANFWKDGHQSKNPMNSDKPNKNDRKYAAKFGRRDWAEVAVVTHPISRAAQGGVSVIPFRPRDPEVYGNSARGEAFRGTPAMPVKRFSTR